MASYLFPTRPEDVPSSLFPSDAQIEQKTLTSQKFLADVAERYSQRNNLSYAEVKNQVDVNGPDSVVPRTNPITDAEENFVNRAYSRQMSVEDAEAAIRAYQVNTEAFATATTATDVVESEIVDPYNPNVDRRAIDMHILNEEVKKIMPEDSISGSVMSMLGMVGYELTKGTFDNFMGTFTDGGKSGRTQEAFNRLAAEPNLAKKREIAKQLAAEMRDLGLYGDNKFLISAELSAIESQGRGLNEGLWTAFDIATLGVGPAIKGIKSVGNAGAKALGIAAARDVVDTAAALKGTVGADMALTGALKNAETTVELARQTAPTMNRVASTTIGDAASPSINPVLNFEFNNEYLESLKDIYKGQYISEESLNAATLSMADNYQKTVKAHVLDMTRTSDNLDNYNVVFSMGRDDGLPFNDFFNAERFAKDIGGSVVPRGDGYVVEIAKGLSLKNTSQATEASELRTFLFEKIASPELSTSARLQTLLKRGTSRIGTVIQDISTTHAQVYKKINSAETKNIDILVKELRDGSDSYRRSWYSTSEFKDKYYSTFGKEPRQEVIDAYTSANKLSEAAWRISADQYLKRSTDQGQFIATIGSLGERKIRPVELYSIPRDKVKHIYDADTGKIYELDNLPKGRKVFQDIEGIQVGDNVAHYITADLKSSRPLLHSDVLGYQAGGSKGTANVTNLLVQEKTVVDISGNSYLGRAKTFLAARSEKEATKALTEVNTILAAIRNQTGTKMSGKAVGLKASITNLDDLQAIVQANNGFNPSIESVDDFLKFMDDSGLNLDDVKVVNSDDPISKMDIGGLDYFQQGNAATYRDLYTLNSNPTSATRDKILFGYGGGNFRMPSPLVSVERDFARSVNYMAQRAYLKNASEGFVKGGQKHMLNFDQIKKLGVYEQVRDAKFTDTVAGRAFAQEARTILSRLEEKSQFSKTWEGMMNRFSERIFDVSKGKIDIFDKMSADPAVALRGFAFDLKLGMFNPDQYIVQASSAANIIAIAPVHGLKAALAYPAMRAALVNTQDGLLKTMSKRVGSMMGMNEKDFVEMMTYVRKSGRFQIDQTVAEINGAYDLSRGVISGLRQKGRVFFNEGERVTRLMAENVAYREFKATYPSLDVTTDKGFRLMDEFMTKRSDTLTMHMTSASASGWQRGILSLPTQWQSYNARFLEALFFGRDLTAAEKVRLGASQLVMYGSAGVGAGGALNWMMDKSSTEMDPDVYTLFRYGLLDSIASNISGVDTAFGSRLGIGEGIMRTIEEIGGEKSFTEVIGGPSVSIAKDSLSAGIGLIQSVWTGNVSVAKQDLTKALRNISSVDKGYRAMWLMQYGEYISKNNVVLAENLPQNAAIMTTIGAQLQAVNFQFDLNKILKNDDEYVKSMANQIKELQKGMTKAIIEDDDMTTAEDFANQIATLRAPLTMSQQNQLNRYIRPSLTDFGDRLYTKATQNNHSALANQLRNVTNKGEVK